MGRGAWLTIEGWRTIGHLLRTQLTIDLLDRMALVSIGRSDLRGAVAGGPYDLLTLVRFVLLAAVATGSWLGGALVERALGALLD